MDSKLVAVSVYQSVEEPQKNSELGSGVGLHDLHTHLEIVF